VLDRDVRHAHDPGAYGLTRAGLLPPPLFELVQQSGNSSIQAIYSFVPRSYARDRLCLVGDAGTVFPPFAGVASSGRWPMPPH
jgi:2-polyprenyl-6-methoxyphenol hydroxylase-like FAD-dependent oxidoreductase